MRLQGTCVMLYYIKFMIKWKTFCVPMPSQVSRLTWHAFDSNSMVDVITQGNQLLFRRYSLSKSFRGAKDEAAMRTERQSDNKNKQRLFRYVSLIVCKVNMYTVCGYHIRVWVLYSYVRYIDFVVNKFVKSNEMKITNARKPIQ